MQIQMTAKMLGVPKYVQLKQIFKIMESTVEQMIKPPSFNQLQWSTKGSLCTANIPVNPSTSHHLK